MSEPVDVGALVADAIRSVYESCDIHEAVVDAVTPVIRRLEQERDEAQTQAQFDQKQCDEVTSAAADLAFKLSAAEAQLRAQEREMEGRVPCSCGQDTANIKNARCYNCRNKPYWELEAAQARVAVLEEALRDARRLLTNRWLTEGHDPQKVALGVAFIDRVLNPPGPEGSEPVPKSRSKEWWLARARAEHDATIGAVGGAVEPAPSGPARDTVTATNPGPVLTLPIPSCHGWGQKSPDCPHFPDEAKPEPPSADSGKITDHKFDAVPYTNNVTGERGICGGCGICGQPASIHASPTGEGAGK